MREALDRSLGVAQMLNALLRQRGFVRHKRAVILVREDASDARKNDRGAQEYEDELTGWRAQRAASPAPAFAAPAPATHGRDSRARHANALEPLSPQCLP